LKQKITQDQRNTRLSPSVDQKIDYKTKVGGSEIRSVSSKRRGSSGTSERSSFGRKDASEENKEFDLKLNEDLMKKTVELKQIITQDQRNTRLPISVDLTKEFKRRVGGSVSTNRRGSSRTSERSSFGRKDTSEENKESDQRLNEDLKKLSHLKKMKLEPMDALNCSWLRLTQEQVLMLEALVRESGHEPGIHAHSNVDNIDVFEELREQNRLKANGTPPPSVPPKFKGKKKTHASLW